MALKMNGLRGWFCMTLCTVTRLFESDEWRWAAQVIRALTQSRCGGRKRFAETMRIWDTHRRIAQEQSGVNIIYELFEENG
jgi:hypothetical protein